MKILPIDFLDYSITFNTRILADSIVKLSLLLNIDNVAPLSYEVTPAIEMIVAEVIGNELAWSRQDDVSGDAAARKLILDEMLNRTRSLVRLALHRDERRSVPPCLSLGEGGNSKQLKRQREEWSSHVLLPDRVVQNCGQCMQASSVGPGLTSGSGFERRREFLETRDRGAFQV